MGLDVHKDTIAVAVAEDGKCSEVREHGEIVNTPAALTRLLSKLGGLEVELHICYEAGPCGYGIPSAACLLRQGTIVDATLIAAPLSTKNRTKSRDPEMKQTRKGNQ